MAHRSLLRILLAALALSAAAARAEHFEIDMGVSRVVKRDFANVGSADLTTTPERDAGFRIRGSGVVHHPIEGSIEYRIELDMQFRMRGDTIQYVRVANHQNRGSEELRSTIEKVLPFVYLVQALPAPAGGTRTLTTPYGTYALKYGAGGEVGLRQGTADVCRFYLVRRNGQTRVARFRVARAGLSLTFVGD